MCGLGQGVVDLLDDAIPDSYFPLIEPNICAVLSIADHRQRRSTGDTSTSLLFPLVVENNSVPIPYDK
jgi:hypothetical protein